MNSNATAMLWKHSKNDEVTNPTTAKDALSETTTESNKDQGKFKDLLILLLLISFVKMLSYLSKKGIILELFLSSLPS